MPTQFVLPDAPREGLVINLAQLRVFYFPKVKEGEPPTVITHPIGIGKVGWSTPEGTTKVTGKTQEPDLVPAGVGAQGTSRSGRSAAGARFRPVRTIRSART